jgi:hypothetical protein
VNETPYAIVQQFTVTANLNQAGKVKVLIDSGSSGNFINESTVKRLKLPTFLRKNPLRVTHVQGGEVGRVERQTKCYMRIRDVKGQSHREIITMDVAPLGKHEVIVGLPWFKVHEPRVDWVNLTLDFQGEYCTDQCLLERGEGSARLSTEEAEVFEIQGKETVKDWKELVPREYHDFGDVFDLEKARNYPP